MSVTTREVSEVPVPHHWTIEEYHQAIDAGVFGDRRVALLDGEIVEMPPPSAPHVGAVAYLAEVFLSRLGWQRASSQTPIILPSDGGPEPDLSVREIGAPLKPPIAQVELVIEVSQATRQRDLGSKLADYLRDGAREVWVIDLVEQCAWIYRGGLLVARHARGSGARLTAELVPEVTVELARVFAAAGLPSA
jgi:Uma2 family endonuclease